MDLNEIKLDIRNQISAIEQTFPRNWGKSFNHELLDDNIDHLEYTLNGISRKYRFYRVLPIITLALLSGALVFSLFFSAIKLYQGTDLAAIYNFGFFFKYV